MFAVKRHPDRVRSPERYDLWKLKVEWAVQDRLRGTTVFQAGYRVATTRPVLLEGHVNGRPIECTATRLLINKPDK